MRIPFVFDTFEMLMFEHVENHNRILRLFCVTYDLIVVLDTFEIQCSRNVIIPDVFERHSLICTLFQSLLEPL